MLDLIRKISELKIPMIVIIGSIFLIFIALLIKKAFQYKYHRLFARLLTLGVSLLILLISLGVNIPWAQNLDYLQTKIYNPQKPQQNVKSESLVNKEVPQKLDFNKINNTLNISDGNTVNLSALVKNYKAGTGLNLNSNTFSLTDKNSQGIYGSKTKIPQIKVDKQGRILDITEKTVDFTDTVLTEQQVDDYVANNGYLLVEVDGSITNELNTNFFLSGDNLTVSDQGGSLTVDLSKYISNTESIDELGDVDTTTVLPNNGSVLTWNSGSSQWEAGSPSAGNTDNQQISLNGATNVVTLSNGTGADTTIDLTPYLDNTDNQDLTLTGNTLALTNDATTVDLSPYLDNTDSQALSIVGHTISLTNGGSVVVPDDDTTYTAGTGLSLAGNTFALDASIDLLSDVDTSTIAPVNNQVLSWNGANWVPANATVNTDDQQIDNFSITANTLSLEIENDGQPAQTVDLSPYLDNTDAQTLSFTSPNLSISGGNSVDISAIDTDTIYTNGNGLSLTGTTFSVNSPTCAGTDKLQWNGTSFVCSADVDTDTTYSAGTGLALSGTTFSLSAGIDLLSDVDTSTTAPTNGQVLSWDGANWVPASTSSLETVTNIANTIVGHKIADYTNESGAVQNINETITSLALNVNSLDYVDEDGTTTNVDLSGYLDNTDDQQIDNFSITANTLSLEIENDGQPAQTVDLSPYLDNTDSQTLSIAGHTISLTNGGSVVVPDNDTTYTAGTGVSLTGTVFALNSGIDNLTDVDTTTTAPSNGQVLSWDGANWVPANDNAGTDDQNIQNLGLAGDTLTVGIEDGTSQTVSLAQYALDTDLHNALTLAAGRDYLTLGAGQVLTLNEVDISDDTNLAVGTGLSLTGDTVSLNSGIDNLTDVDTTTTAPTNNQVLSWDGANWIPANATVNTDDQTADAFNIASNILHLSLEDDGAADYTVDLSPYLDNTDSQTLSFNTGTNILSLTNGGTVDLSSLNDEYTAGNGLNLSGANQFSVNSPTCAGTDKLQWNGTAFVCSADVDTDTTYTAGTGLSLTGTVFALSAGIDLLSDVDTSTTAPTNGDLISWDGTNWVTTSPTNYTDNIYTADGTLTGNRDVALNGNNLIFSGSGNVGIGANNPINKLQVNGNVRATRFVASNGTAGSPTFRFDSDPDTGMFRGTTNQLAFTTGGSERVRIDNNGRVGIGTSVPDSQLQVNGNAHINKDLKVEDSEIIYTQHDYKDEGLNGETLNWNLLQTHKTEDPNDRDFATITSGTGYKQTFPITRWKIGDEGSNGQHYGYVGYFPDTMAHDGAFRVNTAGHEETDLILGVGTKDVLYIDNHNFYAGLGTDTPDQLLDVAGNMRLRNAFYDHNNQPGTAGQILSSTVNGTDWIDAPTSATGSIDTHSDVDTTTTAPTNNQVLSWDGANWVPANDNTGTDDQNISGSGLAGTVLTIGIENGTNETVDLASINTDDQTADAFNIASNILHLSLEDDGAADYTVDLSPYLDNTDSQTLSFNTGTNILSLTNGGTVDLSSLNDEYTAGNGLNLSGANQFSVNSPTCAGTDKLQWNGTAFVCSADVDTDTTYTAGTGLSLTGTVFALNSGIDNLTDVDTTTTAPTNNQVLSWDGANWVPADNSEHTGTTGSIFFANNSNGEPTEDNANFFWDDANDRLGIGTSAPGYDVDIQNANSSSRLRLRGNNTGYTNAAVVLEANHTDVDTRGLGIFMFDNAGDDEWYTGRPYANSDRFVINRKGSVASHDESLAEASSTNNLFTILNNGNTGIDFNNPTEKLEVNGNIKGINNSYLAMLSDPTAGQGGYFQGTAEAGANAGYGAWMNYNTYWDGSHWVQPRGSLNSLLYTTNHHLGWSWQQAASGGTDGGNIMPTEVANIDTSGNMQLDGNVHVDGVGDSYIMGDVGIGTTSPSAKLEINGQVKITGGNPGDGKVLTSDANGLAEWKDIDITDQNLQLESSRMTYENYNASFLMSGDKEDYQYHNYINANPTKREIVRNYSAPGASGSLKVTGAGSTYTADDFIAVNPDKEYRGVVTTMQPQSNTAGARYYWGIVSYDADKLMIQHQMVNYYGNTVTTLSQDLNPGDTVMHLTDVSNWYDGSQAHRRGFRVWRLQADGKYAYVGPGGKQYDELGYSREGVYHGWDQGAIDSGNNTITLISGWSGSTIPAGTKLANFYGGGTYTYYISSQTVPNDGQWHNTKSSWRSGEGKPQNNNGDDNAGNPAFRNGTSYVKMLGLFNYRKDDNTAYDANDVGYYSILGLEAGSPDTLTDNDTLADLNCADGEIAKWNAGAGAWQCSSDAGISSAYDVYDNAGGQSPGSSVITVNMDTVRKANSNYTLATDEITVNSDGLYEVTFAGSADDTNSTRSTTAWFLQDDSGGSFAEVDGSRCFTYQRTTADGENSCSRTVILNLTNGDKVRLQMDVLDNNGGTTTLADGSSITIKKFIESGADYAEVYYTQDKDLSAGDIVTLDSEIKAGVKKAQTNSPIIGVVSTDPGKTIGAGTHWEEGRPVPVALNGRVPVKVELEEGEKIVAGDRITVSQNKVGFGTKTTQPGYILGIALTGFNGENSKAIDGKIYGTVLVFLDKQWFPGDDTLLAQQFNKNNNEILSENISQLLGLIDENNPNNEDEDVAILSSQVTQDNNNDEESQNFNNLVVQSIQQVNDKINNTQENLVKLSDNITTLTELTTQITTTLEDHEQRIAKLENKLADLNTGIVSDTQNIAESDNSQIKNTIENFAKNLQIIEKEGEEISFDLEGNLTIKKLTAETITTEKIIIDNKNNKGDEQSVGKITIPAGETSIKVENKLVNNDSHIILTPHQPVVVGLGEIENGKSFEIELKNALDKELEVEWLIVLEK